MCTDGEPGICSGIGDVNSGRARRRPRRAGAGLNAVGARSEVLRARPVVAATGPPAAPQSGRPHDRPTRGTFVGRGSANRDSPPAVPLRAHRPASSSCATARRSSREPRPSCRRRKVDTPGSSPPGGRYLA